jgi:lipoprotein-anchoring transpeptidase ErfK/SrfK
MSNTRGGAVRRRRRILATAAASAILVVDLLGAASAGAHSAPQLRASGASRTPSHPLPRADRQYVAPYTFLASLKKRTPGFSSRHDTTPKLIVPKKWHGTTTAMPITKADKTRFKVRLARRPNESQVWVRGRATKVSITTFSLVLDLSKRRMYEFKLGRQIHSFPVGIGLPQTPTPTGTFFLAFHADPTGPGYGAVMLETSAHSKVLRTFDGGNDAIIAIHGPITAQADAAIGNDGARLSHGCIRMHNRQLLKLAWVPDGSPIAIVP